MKHENIGLKLRIVGEGDGLPAVVDLAETLDLSDCVEVEGFQPIEKLVPMIMEADVGIVPILHDAFTKHMLPVKLLEYVALRKPVICSRTDTIMAYFDDSMVQYFTPGNAEELAESIRLLYWRPDLRKQLVNNADKFSRDHNWEQEKHRYYQLVDGLVGE